MKDSKSKNIFKGPAIWIVLGIIGIILAVSLMNRGNILRVDTSTGLELLRDKKAESVRIHNGEQRVEVKLKDSYEDPTTRTKSNEVEFNYVTPRGPEIVDAVEKAEPEKGFTDVPVPNNIFGTLLTMFLPILLLFFLFWFIMGRMQGGSMAQTFKFAKHKAKLMNKDTPKTTFVDVAGEDEAVEELQEVKDFLTNPQKYQAIGAKIPKGVLLYGPPGTGKTLLARAVAGEAGVPFYSISGSDFVEMFVGLGASRVRDLFEEAKNNSPSIIFMDEIDAIGRHRGIGIGNGSDEREQTLNQLLVEMDGFDDKTDVIMIAATNRPDVLDPALLRPGRFDRQISVEAPDMRGRRAILEVHAKNKPLSKNVSLDTVAKRTPGFTGADLANVLNEAALLTARSNAQIIDDRALDEAIDRVLAGPQKKTRIISEHSRKITAYHEGGHALVAAALHNTDPVTKITILPRGRALGYTMVVPGEDKHSTTRHELLDQLAYAIGGRVAEETVFHDPTTGASNDIEKATAIARQMVTQYGMSERIGSVKLGRSSEEPGQPPNNEPAYSDEVAHTIDQEVRRLIENAHDEAHTIIKNNRDVLDRLAKELLERETLNEKEISEIFDDIRKHTPRKTWLSSPDRPVSDIPPIKSPRESGEGHGAGPADPECPAPDPEEETGEPGPESCDGQENG